MNDIENKGLFMTNLEYLSEFLSDNYGAICFLNCKEDGYVEFGDENKSMETLSVYFANRIDAYNPTVKQRLVKSCGKNFYKRYPYDIKLSPLGGSFLATRYEVNGTTLTIKYRMPTFNLCGGVWEIIKYFTGTPIDNEKLEFPKLSAPIKSNTNFIINEGDNIKDVLESYLLKQGKPLINRENGFFVASNPSNNVLNIFGEQILKANEICAERGKAFRESLSFMTESDWDDYKRAAGVYEQEEKAKEFRRKNPAEN